MQYLFGAAAVGHCLPLVRYRAGGAAPALPAAALAPPPAEADAGGGDAAAAGGGDARVRGGRGAGGGGGGDAGRRVGGRGATDDALLHRAVVVSGRVRGGACLAGEMGLSARRRSLALLCSSHHKHAPEAARCASRLLFYHWRGKDAGREAVTESEQFLTVS